jgi:hypothetical protein
MGSQKDVEKNMRLRMKGVVASQGFSGDKNSKATASAAKAAASKPVDQERNRQLRETEANKRYNENKGNREAAARAAARKSADRLKPPAAPATSTAPSAKKSAVTRMIEGFKSGAGKGGRIGGLGALRTGGGVPRVK